MCVYTYTFLSSFFLFLSFLFQIRSLRNEEVYQWKVCDDEFECISFFSSLLTAAQMFVRVGFYIR